MIFARELCSEFENDEMNPNSSKSAIDLRGLRAIQLFLGIKISVWHPLQISVWCQKAHSSIKSFDTEFRNAKQLDLYVYNNTFCWEHW